MPRVRVGKAESAEGSLCALCVSAFQKKAICMDLHCYGAMERSGSRHVSIWLDNPFAAPYL